MVKNLLAILLGALILSGSTEIHELLKFPLLIQHYLQHQKKDASLTFIEFVKIHYSDKEHPTDNDDNEDNKLPFRSTDGISHIDTPLMENGPDPADIFHCQQRPIAYFSEGTPAHKSFSIFHPPRIA